MTIQQLLQSTIDSTEYKAAGIQSLAGTFATTGTVTVTPTPPAPPPVVPQIVTVSPGKWFKDVGGSDDLDLHDVCISNGGLVHFISSGVCAVRNCQSLGAPAGKGMYFIVVATGGAKSFLLDNTGLKFAYITHGNEAAIRIMGGCQKATLLGVDLVGRMHDTSDKGADDPTKTKLLAIPKIDSKTGIVTHPATLGHNIDWWKQVIQFRDVKEALWQGGRCIGRWDVGQQATPNTPQKVGHLLVEDVGLTDEPHLTDPKSYGLVERKNCYRLNLDGSPMLKGGALVKWPDQQWRGK